jgi:hypothetical protein
MLFRERVAIYYENHTELICRIGCCDVPEHSKGLLIIGTAVNTSDLNTICTFILYKPFPLCCQLDLAVCVRSIRPPPPLEIISIFISDFKALADTKIA